MADQNEFCQGKIKSIVRRHINIFGLLIVALAVISCEVEKADTAKIKDELEARKFKKIKPGELMAFAEEQSKMILDSLEKINSEEEKSAFLTEQKASFKLRSDVEGLGNIEKNLFEAYEYSAQNGGETPDNIQSDDHGASFIFTRVYTKTSDSISVGFLKLYRRHLVLKM